MATSTLIQYLEADASGASNRAQTETFLASAAITAGDLVEFDAAQTDSDRVLYVKQCVGVPTKGSAAVCGIALETVAAGARVKCTVAGYHEGANVAAATTAGDALVGPIGTAGRAEIEVPGTTTGAVFAIALEADTANVADVWVVKRF